MPSDELNRISFTWTTVSMWERPTDDLHCSITTTFAPQQATSNLLQNYDFHEALQAL